MDARHRIPDEDWPAFEAWARHPDEDIDVLAEKFQREYRGDYRSLKDFAFVHAMFEHNLVSHLLPFFDVQAYIEWLFGDGRSFASIGHREGVWIFQIGEEKNLAGPLLALLKETP